MSEVNSKLITIQGGAQYLQVQHRILWLREAHPGAQIITEIVSVDFDQQRALVRCTISIPEGGTATAYGSALAATLSRNKDKFIEWAETRSVGRALAFLGFSTAGAQDLDEDGPDEAVDAPLQPQAARQAPRVVAPKQESIPGAVTATQKKHIIALADALGWSAEDMRMHLKRNGFASWHDMTELAAAAIITDLEARAADLHAATA